MPPKRPPPKRPPPPDEIELHETLKSALPKKVQISELRKLVRELQKGDVEVNFFDYSKTFTNTYVLALNDIADTNPVALAEALAKITAANTSSASESAGPPADLPSAAKMTQESSPAGPSAAGPSSAGPSPADLPSAGPSSAAESAGPSAGPSTDAEKLAAKFLGMKIPCEKCKFGTLGVDSITIRDTIYTRPIEHDGAMTVVFKAELPDDDDSFVAVKAHIIPTKGRKKKSNRNDGLYGEAFKLQTVGRELKEVVQILGFIQMESAMWSSSFLLMEYVENSLAQLAGTITDETEFSKIAKFAIGALQKLHQKEWLHLDIKPANMLLRRPSRNTTENPVVLCDLEHARPMSVLQTKQKEEPGGTVAWRSIRQDRLALGDERVHEVPSWFDDLEALVYTLLTLACGGLPWLNLAAEAKMSPAKMAELVKMKQQPVVVAGPLHGVSPKLNRLLEHVRKPEGVDMNSYPPPDYAALMRIFG